MSLKDVDRIELVKAQRLAQLEGKLRVSIKANGKEYTYASIETPKGSVRLWLIFHGS